MLDSDKKTFAGLYAGVCANYGRDVTQEVMALWWSQLKDHSLDEVSAAINAHVRTSRFAPTVADIIDKMQAVTPGVKRLSADEAWAMMPTSEAESIVWSEEMAQAYAIASPLLVDGDRIGARMAFKSAYDRLCEQAKVSGKPVSWSVCRGWDTDNLEAVVTDALRLGRLSPEQGHEHVAALEHKTDFNVALLVNEASKTASREVALEFCGRLRDMLTPKPEMVDWQAIHAELEAFGKKMTPRQNKESITGTHG